MRSAPPKPNRTCVQHIRVQTAKTGPDRFSSLMERLRDGRARRFIIVFRNRPQAVLLHVSEYERLLALAQDRQPEAA